MTIGELADLLPNDGEWVYLPEYGMRVKKIGAWPNNEEEEAT